MGNTLAAAQFFTHDFHVSYDHVVSQQASYMLEISLSCVSKCSLFINYCHFAYAKNNWKQIFAKLASYFFSEIFSFFKKF